MIRTKTQIFIQRLNLEMQSLREYASLIERWNEDDNQDEVLQEAELDVINRIGATLQEMCELQSHEWSVMYKALQDSAEKTAADPKPESTPILEPVYFDIGEEAEQNG